MAPDFNLYVARNSWQHRLDPRVKLAFVASITMLVFLWPTAWAGIAVLILCSLLSWMAQIPASRTAGIWRTMAPLILLVFALTALFAGGDSKTIFVIGPLPVTIGGVNQGALLAIRLMALALVYFLWLATTDQSRMVQGFVALGMPYEWGLTLSLALRYLPVFSGLFEQVREAQEARGLNLQQRTFTQRLVAYRPVLIAMLISALRNSERLGWALESRALGAQGVRRTVFRPLRMRRDDWIALTVLLLAFIGILAARFI